MFSTTPAYNLKVVLKETGLAADTLRAWERRYGLPIPDRTAGGHRLYSQRDLETIKWLMKRQEEGLSISRAVDMWNEQTASGVDPLAGATSPTSASPLTVPSVASDSTLASLRSDWIKACMNFNETNAEQIINQAFSVFPIEVVCNDLLQKGMSEIGALWYENKLTVQQEHFASNLAIRRLDALLAAAPASTRKETILVGCPADEWHTFTPLFLSLLLRRRGYKVIYLGANVPIARFTDTVKEIKADLVILVAQQLSTAATLQETALILNNQGIPVGFGGRIFNLRMSLQEYVPGFFLGNELGMAVNEIENILNSNGRQAKRLKAVSQAYLAARQTFASNRTRIESMVKETLEPLAISPDDINTSIHFLGKNITAALQLGDMTHISAEIEWLKALLASHATHPEQLVYFMETYSNAVDKNINGQGKPIFEWFSAEVEKLKAS